jgi:hypothetical protein
VAKVLIAHETYVRTRNRCKQRPYIGDLTPTTSFIEHRAGGRISETWSLSAISTIAAFTTARTRSAAIPTLGRSSNGPVGSPSCDDRQVLIPKSQEMRRYAR